MKLFSFITANMFQMKPEYRIIILIFSWFIRILEQLTYFLKLTLFLIIGYKRDNPVISWWIFSRDRVIYPKGTLLCLKLRWRLWKMASKSEIVRITYKELESSVQDKDRSHRYTDKSSNDGNTECLCTCFLFLIQVNSAMELLLFSF